MLRLYFQRRDRWYTIEFYAKRRFNNEKDKSRNKIDVCGDNHFTSVRFFGAVIGRTIGTKGEQIIKVVFDSSGKIWTAFPVK